MGESEYQNLSNKNFLHLYTGGDYEASRTLMHDELVRRGLAIQALGTVDMPVAEFEDYQIPNPSEATSRWLHAPDDDGETIVRGEN